MSALPHADLLRPLSARQREIFLEHEFNPDCAIHNIGGYCWINGEIDLGILESAVRSTIAKTDALRLIICPGAAEKVPDQKIVSGVDFTLERCEFASEGAAVAWMKEDFSRPFPLYGSVLYRFAITQVSPRRHALLLKCHHIIGDAVAVMLTFERIAGFYNGVESSADAAGSFVELIDEETEGAVEAPKHPAPETGNDALSALAQPLFRRTVAASRMTVPTAHVHEFDLPVETMARLEECAWRSDGSVLHVLLAALHACFGRRASTNDIVFGVSLANRRNARRRSTIGLATSVAPLRLTLDYALPLSGAIRTVAMQLRRAYRRHRQPLSAVMSAVELHAAGRERLCDITVTQLVSPHERLTMGAAGVETIYQLFGGFESKPLQVFTNFMDPQRPGRVSLVFGAAYFAGSAAEHAAQALACFLEQLARAPDPLLMTPPVVSSQELREIAGRLRGAAVECGPASCAHDLIDACARRHPDAVALVHGGDRLSYAELVADANQLAHRLRANGVATGTVVGIFMDRSVEMIVAMLGIMKAGAAFLPLDLSSPAQRLDFVLGDAGARLVLVGKAQRAVSDVLPPGLPRLEVDLAELDPWPDTAPDSRVAPEHLAYLIYTSGSTGQPKGVQVAHRGLCNLMVAQQALFGMRPDDRVLQFARSCFDASVWDVVMALGAGAALCLASTTELTPGGELQSTLLDRGITVATLPPAALPFLQPQALPQLRAVISAGEACPPDLARAWAAHTQFFNAYGPTETSVCATVGQYGGEGLVAMGAPIANTRLRVLDAHLNPVAIGTPGELYVAGPPLARGYVGRSGRTAERFVADVFEPGARMYRTGDLVRLTAGGDLEFLGRGDDQVKIRGFRIELGEVEDALRRHALVAQAAAVKREFGLNDHRLVAYVTLQEGADVDEAALRAHLAAVLPDYALPASIVVLQAMPVNANGKLDKSALPKSSALSQGEQVARPEHGGDAQDAVLRVWSELLGRERIPAQGNFFELGGDSLLLSRALQLLNAQLSTDLAMVDLLRHPTAAGLAWHIEQRRSGPARDTSLAQKQKPTTKGRGLLSRVFAGTRVAEKIRR